MIKFFKRLKRDWEYHKQSKINNAYYDLIKTQEQLTNVLELYLKSYKDNGETDPMTVNLLGSVEVFSKSYALFAESYALRISPFHWKKVYYSHLYSAYTNIMQELIDRLGDKFDEENRAEMRDMILGFQIDAQRN